MSKKKEVGRHGGQNAKSLTVVFPDGSKRRMSLAEIAAAITIENGKYRDPSSVRVRWISDGKKDKVSFATMAMSTTNYRQHLKESRGYVNQTSVDLSHIPAGDLSHLSDETNTGAGKGEIPDEVWFRMRRTRNSMAQSNILR